MAFDVNGQQVECTVQGSIKCWNEMYGEDADGRRGQMIVDSEITEWEVLNLNNQQIVDETILRKAEEIYEKEYSEKDNTIATGRHSDE